MTERNFTWRGYRFEYRDGSMPHGSDVDPYYSVTYGRQGNWNDGDPGNATYVGTVGIPEKQAKKDLIRILCRNLADKSEELRKLRQKIDVMTDEVERL